MSEFETPVLLCDRCESPLEAEDLRCSICGKSAPRETVTREKVVVQVLRCTGCGAAVAYDPKYQAPACSFCDSVVKLETIEDPMEQTEGYLPFTVTPEQARRALGTWLASLGWFRPSDLTTAARLEQLRPLWWVAWVFDAEAFVSWAADSNAGAQRSAWAPHSGQTELHFDDILVSASRGLTATEASVVSRGLDLRTVREHPEGAENATLEQFDLQRSQARQQVTNSIHGLAAQRVSERAIPGSRFRNVRVAVILSRLVTRRLSLPAYVLAYRYKDQLYRVVICGQDAKIVHGSAPHSVFKIFMTVVGVALLLAVVIAILAAASG